MQYGPNVYQKRKVKLSIKRVDVLLDQGLEENSEFSILDYNVAYDRQCLKYFKETFEPIAISHGLSVNYIKDHPKLFEYLQKEKPEFIINLVNYGFMGNEKSEYFPALFEMMSIPFSNAGMIGMSLSWDKKMVQKLALSENISAPMQIALTTEDILSRKVDSNFCFPAFLKLRFGKGSCGVSELNYVESCEELYNNFPIILERYYEQSALRSNQWLLQEYLPGPEYNVGVIGNHSELLMLPIMEDRLEIDQFKTYDDKKMEKEALIPADLDKITAKRIQNSALKLFNVLECRDYCRMDYRCDQNGIPKIMDVNPTANYGQFEAFAKSAEVAGWDGTTLRRELFLIALKRNGLACIH